MLEISTPLSAEQFIAIMFKHRKNMPVEEKAELRDYFGPLYDEEDVLVAIELWEGEIHA